MAEGTTKLCKSGPVTLTFENAKMAEFCPIPSPTEWPPLVQLPENHARAVRRDFFSFKDLPDESCRKKDSICPVTILMTGTNQTLAQSSNH